MLDCFSCPFTLTHALISSAERVVSALGQLTPEEACGRSTFETSSVAITNKKQTFGKLPLPRFLYFNLYRDLSLLYSLVSYYRGSVVSVSIIVMECSDSFVTMNGTQVSYIGHDCDNLPEFLGERFGHLARRLDLSFNQLSGSSGWTPQMIFLLEPRRTDDLVE
ncbi:hypothetical protein DPEC_G00033730, partial [Dallia pectoralis]